MIKLFHPHIPEEFNAKVEEILKSGWIGQGPMVDEFEKAFAKYTGAKYAVMTNSATSALNLAVEVSGVGPGDEVLTTSMTFISTNHAILNAGATPVFVDIDPETLLMDLDLIRAKVTSRTKAIMAVHYAGNPFNMLKLYALAGEFGLKVIEDAAHACGAFYDGKPIGGFGLTCFSFHAVKNLPTGDGGMVTTNDEDEYNTVRSLTWLGIDKSTFARSTGKYKWEYDIPIVGYKYHSNDIAAVLGVQGLEKLNEWNEYRKFLHREYATLLPGVEFLKRTPKTFSSAHLCVIRVPNRDALHDRLEENNIETGVHYKPNHLYPMYQQYDVGDLVETEKAYKEILSLPMHLKLGKNDISYITGTIKRYI